MKKIIQHANIFLISFEKFLKRLFIATVAVFVVPLIFLAYIFGIFEVYKKDEEE